MRVLVCVMVLACSLRIASGARADEVPDAQSCYRRSRELGMAQDFDRALAWVDRGIEQAPHDADLMLWRVRLLGWSGKSDEAIRSLDALVQKAPEVMNDRETIQLAHDLRIWREGDEQRAARIRLGIAPSVATSERGDELATRVWALARMWRTLRLGVASELRVRDDVADQTVSGIASFDAATWTLEAEAGGALDGAFLPHLSLSLEPSLRLSEALWAHLRYWRIDFGDEGAHVLAPGVTLTFGDLDLDLRWWLGWHDGAGLTNAGLVRARWSFDSRITAELGAGGGDAADYLDARGERPDHHWLVLAGLRWTPAWRHRVFLGYALRQETAGVSTTTRHDLSLGYQLEL